MRDGGEEVRERKEIKRAERKIEREREREKGREREKVNIVYCSGINLKRAI